ncbi:hypothetical protein AB0F17_62010 [Nonomuraea sp. NPDC026600]|uniref:hypothetical protein n=1 Tax=Nonomuraea sp. NPDC026600 TaxID=3155363 RepID=UPI0033F2D7B5
MPVFASDAPVRPGGGVGQTTRDELGRLVGEGLVALGLFRGDQLGDLRREAVERADLADAGTRRWS